MPRTSRWAPAVLLAVVAVALWAPAAGAADPAGKAAPPSAAFRAATAGPERVHGLIPDPVQVGRVAGAQARALRAASLPAAYDLRDLAPDPARVTGVRNQGNYNTCWAFAVLGSLESELLPAKAWDFSEDNMIMRNGYGPFSLSRYGNGGTFMMALSYLDRWAGPLNEARDPYPTPSSSPSTPVRKHVQGVELLPARSGPLDNDLLKQAVVDHGAVAVSMDFLLDGGYYDIALHTYYSTGNGSANHAVCVVGWDDSYPAADFSGSPSGTPPGDGAFIVRNSWSDGWGDAGYFYVSYYDDGFAMFDNSVAFTRVDAIGHYARAYQYDKLGMTGQWGSGSSTGWFANRFIAQATQQVAAVGFYTTAQASTYKVYAGATLRSRHLVASGSLAQAGYHTVDFDSAMPVTAGRQFVVEVQLDTPASGGYPIPVELRYKAQRILATAARGQSYVSSNGADWYDLAGLRANSNVCLKAFTRN